MHIYIYICMNILNLDGLIYILIRLEKISLIEDVNKENIR